METAESSSPATVQGTTGGDSISSVLQFVTEFSANALLFGMAAQWIKEASQTLIEIQIIAVQHEISIAVLNEKQNTTDVKVQENLTAINGLRTRLDALSNVLERVAKHNGIAY